MAEMENLRRNARAFSRIIGDTPFVIPPAFIAKHGVFFPTKLTLEVDHQSGNWPVNVVRSFDGRQYKLNSVYWRKFKEDNGVQSSDTVVFSFVDDSRIIVTIFDADGCKRDHYSHPTAKFTFTWAKRLKNCMVIKGTISKAMGLNEETHVKIRNLNGCEYRVRLFKPKKLSEGRVGMGHGWARFVDDSNMVEDKTYQFKCCRGCHGEAVLQLSLFQDYQELSD